MHHYRTFRSLNTTRASSLFTVATYSNGNVRSNDESEENSFPSRMDRGTRAIEIMIARSRNLFSAFNMLVQSFAQWLARVRACISSFVPTSMKATCVQPRKAVYPTFPMKRDIEQVLVSLCPFLFPLFNLPRSHFIPRFHRCTLTIPGYIDQSFLSLSLFFRLFFFVIFFFVFSLFFPSRGSVSRIRASRNPGQRSFFSPTGRFYPRQSWEIKFTIVVESRISCVLSFFFLTMHGASFLFFSSFFLSISLSSLSLCSASSTLSRIVVRQSCGQASGEKHLWFLSDHPFFPTAIPFIIAFTI